MKIVKKILSAVYFLFYKINYFLFNYKIKRQFSFKPYIISIGNIAAGGTGKTPMIITVSQILSGAGLNHAIVSRGYKRKNNQEIVIQSTQHANRNIEDLGDEPFLLAKKLPSIPIIVGNKKDSLNLGFKTFSNNIMLIDDGFQSLEIKKNCDIVLIDLSRKIEEYKLLPYGMLREPLKNIRRAHIIIFTKSNYDQGDAQKIEEIINSLIDLQKTHVFKSKLINDLQKYSFDTQQFTGCKNIQKKKLIGFCGIAKPLIFNKLIDVYCKPNTLILNFPDHCDYEKDEVLKIKRELRAINSNIILTTMKDFYKIKDLFQGYSIYIIDIKHEIENIDSFKSLLLNKLFTP
jgi:tetraacyldisaccharide 4'-kinase